MLWFCSWLMLFLSECHLFDLCCRAFLLLSTLAVILSKWNNHSAQVFSGLVRCRNYFEITLCNQWWFCLASHLFLPSSPALISLLQSCFYLSLTKRSRLCVFPHHCSSCLPFPPFPSRLSQLLQGLLFVAVKSTASSEAWHLLRCEGRTEVKWLDCSTKGDKAPEEDLTALLMRALWPRVPAPTKFGLKRIPAGASV